jgi:signal transduction histidine kinase
VAIGSFTVHRVRADFDRQVLDAAIQLPSHLRITTSTGTLQINPPLEDFTTPADHAVIKILALEGTVIDQQPRDAPALGPPELALRTVGGYRVVSRPAEVRNAANGEPIGKVILQYARPISDVEDTIKRIELFLFVGVMAGTALAFLAGMMIARRAMAPIALLTSTAAEIARTRDPSRHVPHAEAEDEVAELSRTLEGMLRELDAARGETEAMLARQRQFVADASHELRTPLTSVLANLELLADSLHGDQGEAASSALRSSQRMRRLVADLLLLARSDVGRVVAREPCDLAEVVVEAAGELGPVSERHEISLHVQPAVVEASRDELHRLTINLLENALRHTPPGTRIDVSTGVLPDGRAELVVADDGPGVPAELAPTLFERFVRGSGDRGGSFGLGLAIVKAVAESHGGTVTLAGGEGGRGARFTVRLPGASHLDDDRQDHRPALQPVVD